MAGNYFCSTTEPPSRKFISSHCFVQLIWKSVYQNIYNHSLIKLAEQGGILRFGFFFFFNGLLQLRTEYLYIYHFTSIEMSFFFLWSGVFTDTSFNFLLSVLTNICGFAIFYYFTELMGSPKVVQFNGLIFCWKKQARKVSLSRDVYGTFTPLHEFLLFTESVSHWQSANASWILIWCKMMEHWAEVFHQILPKALW